MQAGKLLAINGKNSKKNIIFRKKKVAKYLKNEEFDKLWVVHRIGLLCLILN